MPTLTVTLATDSTLLSTYNGDAGLPDADGMDHSID